MRNLMRIMVSIGVLAAALVTTLPAQAKATKSGKAGNLAVEDFEGSYNLVHGTYGQCETEMNIYREGDDVNYVNVFAGSNIFTNVGAGPTLSDDQFEHVVSTAQIKGHTLMQSDSSYDKIAKRSSKRFYSVTLNGSRLHFISRDSLYPNLPFDCTYKRVADQDPIPNGSSH